jgi:hypothetical protein
VGTDLRSVATAGTFSPFRSYPLTRRLQYLRLRVLVYPPFPPLEASRRRLSTSLPARICPRLTAVKLRLVSQDPLASPREIVLDQFPAIIGRGVDVALRIDDRWLSRRHCELTRVGDDLFVRDLGSRHGTYVNGQPIESSRLLPGNELCLGLSHFLVELVSEESLVPAGHDSGDLDSQLAGIKRGRAVAIA